MVIVAGAGNNGGSANNFYPANCANVVSVAAITKLGTKASYTNTGTSVALSAPGGDNVTTNVFSTSDSGLITPTGSNAYISNSGTSISAPHVSGVASLMRSVNTGLTLGQVKNTLRLSTKVFPTGSGCTTSTCGSGIVNGAKATQLARSNVAGSSHTLAVKSDGTVLAWGYNASGELGIGSTVSTTVPVQVTGLTGVISVAAGSGHSLALKSDGTIWAWGQLAGNGTATNQLSPTHFPGLSGAVAISAGWFHSMVLKADGTVWSWGEIFFGEVGDGSTIRRLSPVQVGGGLTSAKVIAAGNQKSFAILTDGTVRAWGQNNFGQLGDASTVDKHTPVTVSGLGGVVSISASYGHTIAAKFDGTVWTWGDNSSGELGNGTTIGRITPATVTNLNSVIQVIARGGSSSALKSDGTVWSWGINGSGNLGDGTDIDRLLPVATLISSVTAICGGEVSFAVKADGSVWASGYGRTGNVGNGSSGLNAFFLSPVQVHGLNNVGLLKLIP